MIILVLEGNKVDELFISIVITLHVIIMIMIIIITSSFIFIIFTPSYQYD